MTPQVAGSAGSVPLISISVVSHGDWHALAALLESLSAHEAIERMQLIVTDNLGNDLPDLDPSGWHSIVTRRPTRPRGFAANHNDAFGSATGEFFCILNPDVIFTQGVLDGLLGNFEGEQADVVAPVLVDASGQIQDSFRELPTPWRILRRRLGGGSRGVSLPSEGLLYPDWIAGMFMLMGSETFSLFGGFDRRYRLYFEDVDLCTRLRLAGLSIAVDPALRVQHDPRRRSRRPGRHFLWHLQGAARFFSSDGYRRARRLRKHA